MILALLTAAAAPIIPSRPSLGVEEGRCSAGETGAAALVQVVGLKDRTGRLRVEIYPPNDRDFLADDNVLVAAHKTFRRAVIPVPASGTAEACVRVPGPGTYAIAVIHSRSGGRSFSLLHDGIGFASDPKLGMGKPHAAQALARIGARPTVVRVTMNYRRGLFSFGPIDR